MTRVCSVSCCKKRSKTSNFRKDGITYHSFPKDPKLRDIWKSFCNNGSTWIPTRYSYICSEHFETSDFHVLADNTRRLVEGTKPSIIPVTQEETPSDVKEDIVSCRICNKKFVSEVALKNHARMEHIDAHLTGEGVWNLLAKDIETVEKPDYFAIRPLATNPGPGEVQACLGCLDTGGGQVDLRGEMEEVFGQLTGLQVEGGSLCRICLHLLRKFSEFRQRCRDINEIISEIPAVTEEALKNVDRKHLKHNYSISDLIDMVCDPCLPEKSDPLIEETLDNDIYMDDDSKIEFYNVKRKIKSDSDNELNEGFDMNHILNHEGNIKDDMVTVVDEAANKTIDYQEESDFDYIWPENNEGVNINDDMVTVVDKAANKTIYYQEESDFDFICPENNEGAINFSYKRAINYSYERAINDDMDTVVDEAANKTIYYQEESDVDVKWPENNDKFQEDDAEINTTTIKQTQNKKKRKTYFNEAKKPHLEDEKPHMEDERPDLEDEKLKHRRSSVVCPNNVPLASIVHNVVVLFDRLKKSFRLEEDPFVLFERIHEESVLWKSVQSDDEETVAKSKNKVDIIKKAVLKRDIKEFLDLNDQFAEVFGVDVDFVSLYSQQREMDERRAQAPPAPFCGLCCKTYIHTDTYERHLRTAHDKDNPMECDVCKYRLESQQKLFVHLLRHARRFTCRECGAAIFTTSGSMKKVKEHLSLHSGLNFMCELCGKKMVNKSSYSSHLKFKHPNKDIFVKCQLCDKIFYQESGVRVHMNKLHSQAVQCDACKAWFIDKRALVAHIVAGCRPEQNSPCPGCGSNFENVALMKEHYRDVHKKYTCHFYKCRKYILGLQAYNAHKEEHSKKRLTMKSEKSVENIKKIKKKSQKRTSKIPINPSIACVFCGKNNFRSAAALKAHQRVHTGEKPFTCDHCSRQFRVKHNLLLHITRLHMAEKQMGRPYLCDLCGLGYSCRANMAAHKRIVHEGRKRAKRDRSHRNKKKTEAGVNVSK